MANLAELLGAYAPGHELEYGGKTYAFGAIDKKTRAALEVAYFKRAREAVYALRGEVPDDEYDRQLSLVTAEYRQGLYGFPGGQAGAYYLGAGLAELVARLAGCAPADAEALCEAMPAEVAHLCLCVVSSSFGEFKKKLLQQERTPKLQALVRELTAGRNGSPGSASVRSTTPPASPSGASASPTTRASPTCRSHDSTTTPETPTDA